MFAGWNSEKGEIDKIEIELIWYIRYIRYIRYIKIDKISYNVKLLTKRYQWVLS